MANEASVEERVAQLEEKLQFLEAKLEAEKNSRKKTMRESLRCTACQKSEILFVKEFDAGTYTVMVDRKGVFKITHLGVLQAFICSSCGHAEMQIETPKALKGRKNVQVLSAPEPNEGPYR